MWWKNSTAAVEWGILHSNFKGVKIKVTASGRPFSTSCPMCDRFWTFLKSTFWQKSPRDRPAGSELFHSTHKSFCHFSSVQISAAPWIKTVWPFYRVFRSTFVYLKQCRMPLDHRWMTFCTCQVYSGLWLPTAVPFNSLDWVAAD